MNGKLLTEPAALDWLQKAAHNVPAGLAVVELGVYQGASLLRMATGARAGHGAHCWGVDPWGLPGAYPDRPGPRRRYHRGNLATTARALRRAGLASRVTLVRGFSTEVAASWAGPKVGLLYVDALHTEEAVLCDHAAWASHLAPGGWVAYDDYCPRFPGVMHAVERLHGNRFEIVGTRLAVARV